MNASAAVATFPRWARAGVAGLSMVIACAQAAPPQENPATPNGPGAISVLGGRELLRDCVPWVPRGLSYFGRIVPPGWKTDDETRAAEESFGQVNMDTVKFLHGDTVRYQVGLPFIDPQSPQFSRPYLAQLREAVALARRNGLSVFLSMQWQGRTRVKAVETLPGQSTLRAWQTLGPMFANDRGVVYELFNEPQSANPPDAAAWEAWRSGHQAVINALRSQGVGNVLLVEGMNGARTLRGAPALSDPMNQLVYGVHPYLRNDLNSVPKWEDHFGRFAADHAVVVTEWSHWARTCNMADVNTVRSFLAYLERKHIGLLAYGADSRDSRVMQMAGDRSTLTRFDDLACDAPGSGPGLDLQRMFEREADAARHLAPVAPAACGLPAK